MMGVSIEDKDPAYNTPAYKASGAKHQDIIVKVVRTPAA